MMFSTTLVRAPRAAAATIHLAISAAIALTLLAAFWFIWYPAPLFRASGGTEIFMMLLGIDATLGPLMTLIVFKPRKKSLKFDLAVIGLVQAAALAYGVHVLLAGRPVYVASLGHRFDLIQANEIDPANLQVAGKTLPWFGPQWVGYKRPTDKQERDRLMFSSLGGVDYGHYAQHHAPLETMREEILKNSKSIADLRKLNSVRDSEITAWLRDHGQTDDSVIFQGLKARAEDMAVILDAKTAKVIGIAPFKPWD